MLLGKTFTPVGAKWVAPGLPWRTGPRVPLLGEHNTEVLAEAGARPGHRPFDRTAFALALDTAGEGLGRHLFRVADPFLQEVGQAVGEVEAGLGRRRSSPARVHGARRIVRS